MHTNGMAEHILQFYHVLIYCRKEAIQKTIMSMTLGKDVSSLFPDVLKNIATADLDQKKLVYLYLMYVNPSTKDILETCTYYCLKELRQISP